MDWQSGYSWLPGLIHLTQAEVRWDLRRSSGSVTVDHAHVYLVLPSLWRRHVRFSWMDLAGADVSVEIETHDDEPPGSRGSPGWRTTLGGMQVEGLRSLNLSPFSWRGEGRLDGDVSFQGRGPLRVDLSHLSMVGEDDGHRLAERLLVRELRFGPHEFRAGTVSEGLRTLDGFIDLSMQASEMVYLPYYLSRYDWLDLRGEGRLQALLHLRQGEVLAGSELTFEGPELSVQYFDFSVRGEGTLAAETVATGGVEITAALEEFDVGLGEQGGVVRGPRLEVNLRSRSAAIYEPVEDLTIEVDLPNRGRAGRIPLRLVHPPRVCVHPAVR